MSFIPTAVAAIISMHFPLADALQACTHIHKRHTDEELWQQQQLQHAKKMPQLTQDGQSSSARSGESTYYSDYHSTLPKPQVRNTLNHREQVGVVTRTKCEEQFLSLSAVAASCTFSWFLQSRFLSKDFLEGCTRLDFIAHMSSLPLLVSKPS